MNNVFNKVTLKSLKKNRTRTIVTIIGIILSAAMICAVTTFASSIINYTIQVSEWENGSWHGNEFITSYETYKKIADSDAVKDTAYLQNIGYSYDDGSKNECKPYINVVGASEKADDMLPIHITEGKYPTNSNEIIIPESLINSSDTSYKIGDQITLDIGDCIVDGNKLNQHNDLFQYINDGKTFTDENIKVNETHTYTIVGFYDDLPYKIVPDTAPGFTAITIADSNPKGEYTYDVYFKMNNAHDVYGFMGVNGISGTTNTQVLMYQGAANFSNIYVAISGLATIIIAIIMLGSVSLIYNAFSISVSERTKQFGLLASLGATKKQIRKMVLFEALVVSAIGIPLGVIAGIGGIGITLAIIGNGFSSLWGYKHIPLQLCVSWEAVVIAILVALLTVLISALIPSIRATRISSIEAIRQSKDIKMSKKPVKTSKLTYKLFGLAGVLANKHYKRNKKKYRTTVISLFMSIVLFVSASSFTDYLMEAANMGLATTDCDLTYSAYSDEMNGKTPDELLEIFKSEENITNATYVKTISASGVIDNKYLTQPKGNSTADNSINTNVCFIPDSEYKKLLKDNGLSESKFYNSKEPLGVAVDGNAVFNYDQQKYVTENILNSDTSEISITELHADLYNDYSYVSEHTDSYGNVIVEMAKYDDPDNIYEFPYDEAYSTYTVKTGKTIYEKPYYTGNDDNSGLVVYYPMSFYDTVIPESLRPENPNYKFYMTSDNHKATYNSLMNKLEDNGISTENLKDYAEGVDINRNIVTIVRVFAYGFIVLISLIAAANVFNTISTNIALRRREFAMLKSVGMTQKDFRKMMNFECLLYGSKSLILGIPVSCLISFLIYNSMLSGFETSFRLPLTAMGIAILSVFIVVGATMIYSMSKVKKDNPIDTLKNENI